jgi:ATP-dependent Clp protease ATP-binding subunit ClpC
MFVDELAVQMQAQQVTLEIDTAVIDKLAHDGFDLVYGARPLRREVERQLENPLAMRIVQGDFLPGNRVKIWLEEEGIQFDIAKPEAQTSGG